MKKLGSQLELEEQNLQISIERMTQTIEKQRQASQLSNLKQTRNIIPFYVDELNSKLQMYVAESMSGRAKIKPIPVKAMTLLDTLIVSHFTVKTIVDFIGNKNMNSTRLYTMIARQLEIEFDLLRLDSKDSKAYKGMTNYLKQSGYSGERLKKITGDLLTKYHADVKSHSFSTFVQVAQLAVHLLSECKPILKNSVAPSLLNIITVVDTPSTKGKPRKASKIIPASWLLEWLREQTLQGNMVGSYHTALIEPPKPWTSLTKGGFHSDRFRNNLIKTQVDSDKFDFESMSDTVSAVNAIQDTEWSVNKEILEAMMYAFENKLEWGDLPSPVEITELPYPFPDKERGDLTKEELSKVKDWANFMASEYNKKASHTSRYLALNRVLNEAKRFSIYDKIYFAYQVDFRGRIYPIAANLHPQGAGFVKPLLHFSEGKRIHDKTAEMYLAMQGANTFGEDKLRLEDKHKWVIANEKNILESANNYKDSEFWKRADEPWEFLAFCFEWRDYKASPKTFLSRLPIAMDGSCNGLQHLSAMLRDEVGGEQVNLTANFTKKDIYGKVKEVAISSLQQDNSPLARKILKFGIERSTCKKPVMIMPYAGTQSSCREYVKNDFDDRGAKAYFKEDYSSAISLTSKVIWDSIGGVVLKGREIMKWFKHASSLVISKTNTKEIVWLTPNGFKVIQRRVKQQSNQFTTSLGDRIRLRVRLNQDTDETDKRGHSTAVSPNFIHSLDACALQNTVIMCKIHGIHSLAMIHDSYGTHAADSKQMAILIREMFVCMYESNDVLIDWIKQQPEELRQDLIDGLPSKGKLDLGQVRDSEHFFA